MEYAASILTAIDFTFKTSKLLHAVISGVKDGPDNVHYAATAIDGLLSALEQLSKCRTLDELGSEALRDRLLKCVDDLESFDKRLKGLMVEDSEKLCGLYWKRLKCVYNEKALDKMRAVVVGHTAALNLHLAILKSETVFGISDQLATIDRRLISQQSISQIPGQLQTIGQELVQQRTERQNQTAMWEEHRMKLGQVSHCVGSLREEIDSAKTDVLAAQTAQGAETNQKLDQILEQMFKLTLERQQSSRVVEVPDHGRVTPKPPGSEPCSELMESMARLCRLVDMERGPTVVNNSTDVIKCLLAMLSCMMSGEFLEGAAAASLIKAGACERCCERHVECLKKCLSSVYGILLSSRRTTLNHHSKAKRLRGDSLVRTHSNATTYFLEIGTLLVCSSTKYYREASDPSEPFHPWTPSTSEEAMISMSFIPSQQQTQQSMFRITSLFTIVREGRLDEFIALLRDGDASVRDHDEYGACLLHYANRQPAMCQYLIKAGVDVNTLGINKLVVDWKETEEMCSPLDTSVNDEEVESQELERILICRKYLLEAGSDYLMMAPEWDTSDLHEGFITLTFHSAVPEAMKLLLDEISFASCRIALDESPLLYSLSAGRCRLEGIKLLLQRGASVHDRDHFGNTCLHEYLNMPAQGLLGGDASNIRDNLIYLIQQGADVFAKNHCGKSVSDVAYYTTKKFDTIFRRRFREELWDCALVNCGYNVAEFRRRRRPAVYSRPCRFTRGHFVDLWAGCEHLRPDYNNKKSAIYFNDPDEASEDDDGDSQLDEWDDPDWSGSGEVSDDGNSQLDKSDDFDGRRSDETGDCGDSEREDVDDSDERDSDDGGIRLASDRECRGIGCCPPFVRIYSS